MPVDWWPMPFFGMFMMPVMMVFVIPMIAWPRLAQEPNGDLARILSYVPPATPMVMVLRLSSGSDIWIGEVLASPELKAQFEKVGVEAHASTPAERFALVWPITLKAWAFKTGVLDEPRLRRDVGRVVRGRR